MLIDNALHNQSNLTNSTKDVGNDKGSSRASSYEKGSAGASPYQASLRIWDRPSSARFALALVFIQSNFRVVPCGWDGNARKYLKKTLALFWTSVIFTLHFAIGRILAAMARPITVRPAGRRIDGRRRLMP
jgi:hypothetical protein